MQNIIEILGISAVTLSTGEVAWKIKDALRIIEDLECKKMIILGGDILNENQQYTYDSWFFNTDVTQTEEYNLMQSAISAKNYISRYIEMNGDHYYVVFVYYEEIMKILNDEK